ncbi:MAG TPA: hypothetical protein VFT87_01600 [Candidatus Saccharimonadales bacterium]|nr:hypothetical protein [Candidatus Saccharimonadales bacterium]
MKSLVIPVILTFALGFSAMALASRGRRLQYPHNFDSPGPSGSRSARRLLVLGGVLAAFSVPAAVWAVLALMQPYARTSAAVAAIYLFVFLGYRFMMDEDSAKAEQAEAIKAQKERRHE